MEDVGVAIYICRAGNVVARNNVLVITEANTYGGGTAIGVTEEPPDSVSDGNLHRVTVYGNIVVGPFKTGLWFAPNNADANAYDINILNNTFVGVERTFFFNNPLTRPASGSVRGNISYPTTTHMLGGPLPNMTFGPNMWSENLAYSTVPTAARHGNDLSATPAFVTPGGFSHLSYGEFAIRDVGFQPGSPGIDVGPDVSSLVSSLFLPTDTDARTATMAAVADGWDYGAVTFGGSP